MSYEEEQHIDATEPSGPGGCGLSLGATRVQEGAITIRKDDGELVAECNECGMSEYGGTLEFREFVDQLKESGWAIRKDGDEWTHTCPDCEG